MVLFFKMIFIYLFLMTVVAQGLVLATKVHLTGPRHVERGEIFWVHCISGEKPVGQLAEFQIDGKTKDSIRLYQHACFSTKTRSECLTNECHCSKDGTSYSLRFAASSSKKTLELTCVMKFSQTQPVFIRETLQVTIMDRMNNRKTNTSNVTTDKDGILSNEYHRKEKELSTSCSEKPTQTTKQPNEDTIERSKDTTESTKHQSMSTIRPIESTKKSNIVTVFRNKNQGQQEMINMIIIGSLFLVFGVLLFLSVLGICNYRKLISKGKVQIQSIENDNDGNHEQNNVFDGQFDIISTYESISEGQMLENLQRNETVSSPGVIERRNVPSIVQRPDSHLSSERSYLEVIGDEEYTNRYESLPSNVDLVEMTEHVYNTINSSNEYLQPCVEKDIDTDTDSDSLYSIKHKNSTLVDILSEYSGSIESVNCANTNAADL